MPFKLKNLFKGKRSNESLSPTESQNKDSSKKNNFNDSPKNSNNNPNTYPSTSIDASIETWGEWLNSKAEGIYDYGKSFFEPELPPVDELERKRWLERQDQQRAQKEYDKRLSNRNRNIKKRYNDDLNQAYEQKTECGNWYNEVRNQLNQKLKDDRNIYVDRQNIENPETHPNWDPERFNLNRAHNELCEKLDCDRPVSEEKPQDQKQLKLESSELSQSTELALPDPGLSDQERYEIHGAKRQLNRCLNQLDDLEYDYRRIKNEMRSLQDALDEAEQKRCEKPQMPYKDKNIHLPNLNVPSSEDFVKNGIQTLGQPNWLYANPILRVLEWPIHVAKGEVFAIGDSFHWWNKWIANILELCIAIAVYTLYFLVLCEAWKLIRIIAGGVASWGSKAANTVYDDYIYKRNQKRQREKERYRAVKRRHFGRTVKNIAHESSDLIAKILQPFKGSNSQESIKRIRGGYIPPFPDSSLFTPQTYVGLTEFEKNQILFAYDPIHIQLKIGELYQELNDQLSKLKVMEEQEEVRVSRRIKTIRRLKSKFSSINMTKVTTKVSSGLGYLSLVMAGLLGTSPPLSFPPGTVNPYAGQEMGPSIQRVRMADEIVSEDNLAERLKRGLPSIRKGAFSDEAIRQNAAMEQLITDVEESEELVVTEKSASKNKNRFSKRKKFNTRARTLADLPELPEQIQEDNSESGSEFVSQKTDLKRIKVR